MDIPETQTAARRARGDRSFPKRLRVRKRGHFMRIQREGARLSSESFLVHARASGGHPVRLGITASKKVGKAHDRNRAKRLTREAFRQSALRAMVGFDLVLIIRQESPPRALAPLISELEALAAQVTLALAQRAGRGGARAGKGGKEGGRGRQRPPEGTA